MREYKRADVEIQEPRRNAHKLAVFWGVVTTVLVLLITGAYWQQEENNINAIQSRALERQVDGLITYIGNRLRTYEAALRGVKGYVEGSDTITAGEFGAYAKAQQIEQSAPGLQGLALVMQVGHSNKSSHTSKMQALGLLGYNIKPEGTRGVYAPIVFIEPHDEVNAKAIGFDVATVAATNSAMVVARDTNRAALSDQLTLVQDQGLERASAFVMYLAIYHKGTDLSSLDARRKGLLGWADGPFRLRDLMHDFFQESNAGIDVRVYSGDIPATESLLYSSPRAGTAVAHPVGKNMASVSRPFEFNGQRWTVVLEPTPNYFRGTFDDAHSFVACVGALLSLIFGWMVWFLMTGKNRALAVATGMTLELNELAASLEGTLNAIPDLLFELDLEGRYHGYRASRAELLAAPPSGFLGKTVFEVLPQKAADACMLALKEADRTGLSMGRCIELLVSGGLKWFEISVAKKKSVSDGGARFVMLSRDITERMQIEQRLLENQQALQDAQQLAGIGHISIDCTAGRWTSSTVLDDMLGINSSFDRSLAQLVLLVAPSQRKAFTAACHQIPAKSLSREMEFKFTRATDGQVRWFRMSVTPSIDSTIEPMFSFATLQDITRHRAVREHLLMLQKSIAGLNDVVLITEAEPIDASGPKIVFVNEAFEKRTGYRRDEVIGKTPRILQGPNTQRTELDRIRNALAAWRPVRAELINYTKSGQEFWLELDIQPIADSAGWFTHWVAVGRDVTKRKRSEQILLESEARYRSMFESNPHPMWVFDTQTLRFLSVNDAAIAHYGYGRDEFLSMSLRDIRPAEDLSVFQKHMTLNKHVGTSTAKIWNHRRKDGSHISVEVSGHAMEFDGRTARLVLVHDITQRLKTEREIEHLAFYDLLTGLPNRRLLLDRAANALQRCKASKMLSAMILIDLDDFKTINDNWGHRSGDIMLHEVAQRLTRFVNNECAVARLGGDEFVVLLEGIGTASEQAIGQAELLSKEILTALSTTPIIIDGHAHRTSASLGVAIFGADKDSVYDILASADSAMYLAKASGRNTYRFFDAQLQAALAKRAGTEADLRLSIERQELFLMYQPQVDFKDRLIGVEALVRWTHPQHGACSPAEFIPLAEQSGFILLLGHWVILCACRTLALWANDPLTSTLTMAVNVSAKQFHHPEFVAQVLEAIRQTGINPSLLKLELTESLLAQDVDGIVEKMSALKAVGISFALDDFGTGYSSLTYLKRLPLDQLKIDQSFVRDVLTDPSDAAIVRTILALGQSLGLSVIAEGVETVGQKEFLERNGCLSYQGYWYSRPLTLDNFRQFIDTDAQVPKT